MLRTILFLAFTVLGLGQRPLAVVAGENMRGAAVRNNSLYTWGESLLQWNLPGGARHFLSASKNGGFGEGGCVDGNGAVFLQDGPVAGPLIAVAQNGSRTQLDRRVEMHDCIATELLGHRGVLITDHYGQVRFYEAQGVYQEVYSFYTPSRQAGLLLSDIDGDGLKDILCGNYWIRSPKEFNLPWRLFAINTRHQNLESATMRLVLQRNQVLAAQGHTSDGLLLRYTPPSDPTQLWKEEVVASGLHFAHALVLSPFGIVAGENSGAGSRLMLLRDDGRLEQIGITNGIHTAFAIGDRILTVGSESVRWFNGAGTRRLR